MYLQELRKELNEATAHQLHAEDLMKSERQNYDGTMTEAEMEYLTAMEEVKTISKQLVAAEQAFSLVRERIEKLIGKYETLLTKIETESFAGASSVMTTGSSYVSDSSEYWDFVDRLWAKRQKRAEVRAEIAARESMLKQQPRSVRSSKIREIHALEKRLDDLRSESSDAPTSRQRAAVVKSLDHTRPALSSTQSSTHSNKNKLEQVKQRFRERMAAKTSLSTPQATAPRQSHSKHVLSMRTQEQRNLLRSAGKEMAQQKDFYERSLKAVEAARLE